MKKICAGFVTVLMVCLLMAPAASAYPVAAGDSIIATLGIGGGVNGGGAFNIDLFGDDPDAGVLFDTFCLENNEHFTPGEKLYIGSITDYATLGGISGGNPTDLLDSRSAYLMSQWASWEISHTAANANALQLAIWMIEGEWTSALTGVAATFYDDSEEYSDGTLYGVQVMNLYGADPTGQTPIYKQDMLVYNPVPEPATMLLLGLGLVGLAGIRKMFKA